MNIMRTALATVTAAFMSLAVLSSGPAQAATPPSIAPVAQDEEVVSTNPNDANSIPPFYQSPTELPATNGQLIRAERINWNGIVMARGTRIMYKSTNSKGEAQAVTGVYYEPWFPWWGPGKRPVVSWAYGTIGQGDHCAPSRNSESLINIRQNPRTTTTQMETLFLNGFLARGVAVVVTDYMGLGTPGMHTYVNRVDQGHAAIDAARTARQVPGSSVRSKSRVGFWGYSQGGGTAASAAELVSTYAPELRASGTFAGAPPADLGRVLAGIDGSVATGFVGYSVNSFVDTYPEMKTLMHEKTSPEGRDALKQMSKLCTADVQKQFGMQSSANWTKTGVTLSEIVATEPVAQNIIDEQRIGKIKPSMPVMVYTGSQDTIVHHEQTTQLAKDWCALGGNVVYKKRNLPDFGTKTTNNHVIPYVLESGPAQSWMVDRLKGYWTASKCPTN